MEDDMDTRRVIEILNTVKLLAQTGQLVRNDDVREDVFRLRNFAEYRSRLDDEAFHSAFAAGAQAWLIVSGTGLPAFEHKTNERVAEYCQMAIDQLVKTLGIHPARPTTIM